MPGKSWRDLAFDRLNLVIGVGARQLEENRTDAGKRAAASFERFDRVFEGSRFWIGRDCSALVLRTAKRDREGLPKVAWLQAIERRRLKRPRPRFEKRVHLAAVLLVHGGVVQFLRRCGGAPFNIKGAGLYLLACGPDSHGKRASVAITSASVTWRKSS